jgi:predicted transcriptional regulator
MSVATDIMLLFSDDDVVMKPAEVVSLLRGPSPMTVHTVLKRLVKRGRLFRVQHSWYARSPNAKPMRRQIAVLREQLRELDERLSALESEHTKATP